MPYDLRTLYWLGMSWDRAASALQRLTAPGTGLSPEAAAVLAAAADACLLVREALLQAPESELSRAFQSATRARLSPGALADLLEPLAGTLSRIKDSPAEAALLPHSSLAGIGEFLSDAGQAVLREVARTRHGRLAS